MLSIILTSFLSAESGILSSWDEKDGLGSKTRLFASASRDSYSTEDLHLLALTPESSEGDRFDS